MTVVFDAEALLAFRSDRPGASEVERWPERVSSGDLDGYIATINLTEFRYIATRRSSVEQADAHIDALRDMGPTEYRSLRPAVRVTAVNGMWIRWGGYARFRAERARNSPNPHMERDVCSHLFASSAVESP